MSEENTEITQVSDTSTDTLTDATSTSSESSDNSSLEDAIAKAFNDEPDSSKDDTTDKAVDQVGNNSNVSDNTVDVPDKFKGKDGEVDVNNLLKSYKELESFSSQQQAKWQEERAELQRYRDEQTKQAQEREAQAQAQGFQSALDMEQQYALINLEANEYAKYLQYTEDPEAVRDMLINYANNPSQEALDEIELEFSPDVIKRVAIAKERQKVTYQNERQKALETQQMTNIESVISRSVEANADLFQNKPFEDLFVRTLKRYGDNFTYEDAEVLMNTMNQMKDAWKQEFQKENGIKVENEKATDKLANISGQNSAPVVLNTDNLSQAELEKYIRKLI